MIYLNGRLFLGVVAECRQQGHHGRSWNPYIIPMVILLPGPNEPACSLSGKKLNAVEYLCGSPFISKIRSRNAKSPQGRQLTIFGLRKVVPLLPESDEIVMVLDPATRVPAG